MDATRRRVGRPKRTSAEEYLNTPGMRARLEYDYTNAPGVLALGLVGARGVVRDCTVMVEAEDGTTISWEEAMGHIEFRPLDEVERLKAEYRQRHLEDKRQSNQFVAREPGCRVVKQIYVRSRGQKE